ncbi:MAG: hypothetical protein QM635_10740, partial [Microbacteriaceae bacterium]
MTAAPGRRPGRAVRPILDPGGRPAAGGEALGDEVAQRDRRAARPRPEPVCAVVPSDHEVSMKKLA